MIFFSWSYEEIPGINPHIVMQEIKTYLRAKPMRQKLRLAHPWKVGTIKEKFKNLLCVGFIYPIPLIECVSNIVPITKKQGTI